METWRLSRIEDELDKLDFTQDPGESSLSDSIFNSLSSDLGFIGKSGSRTQSECMTDPGKMQSGSDNRDDEGYSEDDNLHDEEPDLPPPPDELLYPVDLDTEYPDNSEQTVKHKEVIYSETVMSSELQRQAEAVNKISTKYDSLQRLKLTPFSATIPPGYVNTSKSPGKIHPQAVEPADTQPVKTPVMPSQFTTNKKGAVPVSIPTPSANAMENIAKPLQCNILPDEEMVKIRNTNSWLELEGQPRISTDQRAENRLSHYKADLLTEQEILQVEIFYRSCKTTVHVCQCETELYNGSVRDKNTFDNFYSDTHNSTGWSLVKSGIPAIVLDNHARKVHLILAERGTGFALWKETLTSCSNYTAVQPNFHTLHLASDKSKLVGLSFQDAVSAADFIQKLNSIIANPEDDIFGKGGKKKKKDFKKSTKVKKPNKADISTPCFFTHITNLDRNDGLSTGNT